MVVKHIAHKIIFELRPPLPTMTLELLLLQFEVSIPCSLGDTTQNVHVSISGGIVIEPVHPWVLAAIVLATYQNYSGKFLLV